MFLVEGFKRIRTGKEHAQRSDVMNEHDAGNIECTLEVLSGRARRRCSSGNDLIDKGCRQYQKKYKGGNAFTASARTLRQLGVFHRHCRRDQGQTGGSLVLLPQNFLFLIDSLQRTNVAHSLLRSWTLPSQICALGFR